METKTTEWYTDNLKRYLEQYKTAVYRRKQLETRLWKVCKEMDRPIGGMHYSPVNVSSKENLGSAAFTLRKSELEARIAEQRGQAAKHLLEVMDIMDYLEPASDERVIMELKYIDDYDWYTITKKVHLSRRTCIRYRDKGLAMLIEYERVRTIVEKFAESDT